MWGDIAIAFLLGLVTAFVVTPFSMRIAKKYGAIDVPNDRRVNKKSNAKAWWYCCYSRIFCFNNIPIN